MSGSDPERCVESDGMPQAVERGEAAALVEAFRRAQVFELEIRRKLDGLGSPEMHWQTVATLDAAGRPAVRISSNGCECGTAVKSSREDYQGA